MEKFGKMGREHHCVRLWDIVYFFKNEMDGTSSTREGVRRGNPEERSHFEDQGVDVGIMRILKKLYGGP